MVDLAFRPVQEKRPVSLTVELEEGCSLCSEPAIVHVMIHRTQGPASAVLLSVCPQFMTLLRSQEVLFGITHCGF